MRLFLTTTALALTLAACGGGSDEPVAPAPTETAAPEAAAPAPEAPAEVTPASEESAPTVEDLVEEVEVTESVHAEAIAALPAPYNTGDYERGESLFRQCATCHLLDAEAGHRVGPNLHGVFGREIGTAPGFNYSDIFQESDFTWDEERISAYLENPRGYLPGNRMSYAGLRRPNDRLDLITFLMIKTAE